MISAKSTWTCPSPSREEVRYRFANVKVRSCPSRPGDQSLSRPPPLDTWAWKNWKMFCTPLTAASNASTPNPVKVTEAFKSVSRLRLRGILDASEVWNSLSYVTDLACKTYWCWWMGGRFTFSKKPWMRIITSSTLCLSKGLWARMAAFPDACSEMYTASSTVVIFPLKVC